MLDMCKDVKKNRRYRVIIAGSREFDNFELLKIKCDQFLGGDKNWEVVSGTARGADRLGEKYAKLRGLPVKKFQANWELHGKSAGYKRNKQMAVYADAAIVFHMNNSRGSQHMIDIAEEMKLPIRIVKI